MNNNDRFLVLYREYESILREHQKEYKDVEEKSPELTQGRLRIGRQIRNYLTHSNDNKFLEVSERMLLFYEGEIEKEKLQDDIVKNYVRSKVTSMVSPKDKCGEALEKMKKCKIPYIFVCNDNKMFGISTIYDVLSAYMATKTAKMADVKVSNKGYLKVNVMDDAAMWMNCKNKLPLFAVDDKGKVIGTVIF